VREGRFQLVVLLTFKQMSVPCFPCRRALFIDSYFKAALRAVANGYDVRGFYYWSLMDNFEVGGSNQLACIFFMLVVLRCCSQSMLRYVMHCFGVSHVAVMLFPHSLHYFLTQAQPNRSVYYTNLICDLICKGFGA